ncbi:MAG: ABC transporter permease [Actinomycetota bacterium]
MPLTQNLPTDGLDSTWIRRLTSGDSTPPSHRGIGAAGATLGILVLWWIVSAIGIWSEIILPSPGQVWDAFVESVTSDGARRGLSDHLLWEHLAASLWRIVRGVFWGVVIGIPLGLALGLSRAIEAWAEPIVGFLRSLPPLGYFSLLIIWFGIDDTSKVWLLLIAAFPPVALSVAAGVGSLRVERINAGLSLGASRRQILTHVVLPSILPDLFTGVRVAIGFAWTTIVAAETSNGIPGIGGLAWATKKQLRTDVAILCVIVIGVVAVLMDSILRAVERRVVPWKSRS